MVEKLNRVKEQFDKQVFNRRLEAHELKQGTARMANSNSKRFQKITFLNIKRRLKQEINNPDQLIPLPKQAEREQSTHEPGDVRHKDCVIKKGGGVVKIKQVTERYNERSKVKIRGDTFQGEGKLEEVTDCGDVVEGGVGDDET